MIFLFLVFPTTKRPAEYFAKTETLNLFLLKGVYTSYRVLVASTESNSLLSAVTDLPSYTIPEVQPRLTHRTRTHITRGFVSL